MNVVVLGQDTFPLASCATNTHTEPLMLKHSGASHPLRKTAGVTANELQR